MKSRKSCRTTCEHLREGKVAKDFTVDDPKVMARFWSKTEVRAADECWLWKGTRVRSGHGQLWNGERLLYAHRYSFALKTGDKALDRIICHRCNNAWCVNPSHLYAGEYCDNTWDAIGAGKFNMQRCGKGEQHRSASMTDAVATEIKLALAGEKETAGAIAKRFGVSKIAVYCIKQGRSWTHIGPKMIGQRRSKLTADQIREIQHKARGAPYGIGTILAREYGVSPARISTIRRGAP